MTAARGYQLVISENFLLSEPAYEGVIPDTSITVAGLAERSYFWRVSGVMADGGFGKDSVVRRFKVSGQSVHDDSDQTPPPLDIVEFMLSGPMVIVNGVTEPGANLWVDNEKIDVYQDGTFYAVIRLRKEGENVVEFLAQDAAGNEKLVRRRAYYESY